MFYATRLWPVLLYMFPLSTLPSPIIVAMDLSNLSMTSASISFGSSTMFQDHKGDLPSAVLR